MIDAVVDLSNWQSVTDWDLVCSSGVLGVILKATQGSHWVDPTFVRRAMDAHASGLLVGAYHFLDASDPATQAAHFLAITGGLPLLALDIEHNSLSTGTVCVEQAAEMSSRVCAIRGQPPLCYIGRDGPDGRGTGLPNLVLSQCDLWLPEYGVETPKLPVGWDEWRLWQWSKTGTVPGIVGPVDLSRWDGTPEELKSWWGQH